MQLIISHMKGGEETLYSVIFVNRF